jgi:23S rRNA (cytosine1962-C5)-methyltransferase
VSTTESSPIHNRIQKNLRKLKPWAAKIPTNCFRVYDRDIPEYPYQVDVFGPYVVLHDRRDPIKDVGTIKQKNFDDTLKAVHEVLGVSPANLVIKERRTFSHRSSEVPEQYQKQAGPIANADVDPRNFVVHEGACRYLLNLIDYIDVGLFLDHRPLRLRFSKELMGKSLLNLFSYTGSVSVAAAIGGAETTSIDLSNTYVEWSKSNFKLNDLSPTDHFFITADVLQYLADNAASHSTQGQPKKYDVIFLDPPTFSNSKKMISDSFEIERDQEFLVKSCMALLNNEGSLYFSNNKRDFKLLVSLENQFHIDRKTEWSLPPDFRDPKTHHLFVIRHK